MNMPVVIFSHGQESGPWGSKITAMAECVRELGCRVESIDYRGMADAGDRVEKLVDECAQINAELILVGSSMGGHVATAAASSVRAIGLFVLAPAYYMDGFEALTPPAPEIPMLIIHGWNDEVVPVENSIRFAREHAVTLHLVDGEHRLTANIDEINHLLMNFVSVTTNDIELTTGAK